MRYQRIWRDNNRLTLTFPYPGMDDSGKMSLAYYKHHRGWTRSQDFRDQVEILGVSQQEVTDMMQVHDNWLEYFATRNKYGLLDWFRKLAFRLYRAHRRAVLTRARMAPA